MTADAPFETVIGLEVHVQLDVASKLFSTAPHAPGGEPNSRVSVVDLGLPGVLPRLNGAAVDVAVRCALALDGSVREWTRFDRKNYFYPDLPKGYQISQFDQPFCDGGRVPLGDDRFGQLERVHLEEDAGKSTHTIGGSLVDLNRAGVALCEIVGRPDLRSPADAHAFLTNLRQILRYAGVSECDMENGSLRCDANISLRPHGTTELGTKVEIKNLNSFKMVERALDYEERRQTALLLAGGEVERETRQWNDERGETSSLRGKEAAADYRYFPDPDLPVLHIAPARVDAIRAAMPELPAARRDRYARAYGLPEYDVGVLTADPETGAYFEAVADACGDAKVASNWLMGEVQRVLKEHAWSMDDLPIPATSLGAVIAAQSNGRVNNQGAKKLFAWLVDRPDADVDAGIAALGLEQIRDPEQLRTIVAAVVAANDKAVADYRNGKTKALHGLKGMVMKETRGQADPAVVEQLLLERL